MSTLDQAVQQADALTDNLSAIAAQNQEANRNANLEVSSVEQLADSSLSSVQAQAQLSNFASITTSSTTTTTSSSSTRVLTLAAAQTSATQQSIRTKSSGLCCCDDEEDPQVLEVTLEDVEIRYGYDAFNEWESEIYAFVIGRVSINIPLASTFTLFMNFDGNFFEVTIPSSLKGGPGWYNAVVDLDDLWPPPYHQVFARGTSLRQPSFCEEKILSVTGYAVRNDPFNVFEKRVSEVELPDPVSLTACPYIGTLGIQEAKNDTEVIATISVDYLPFILPLKVGVAYGDAFWQSDTVASGGSVSVDWVWEGLGAAPSTTPQILEVTIGTAQYRYFDINGSPTNNSSSVYWAWDVFSKQYQLQLILLDWRWNGSWEYVGPRWDNYYNDVTFWPDDYEPQPPVSGPPSVIFPEPEAVTATFGKGEDCYSTWIAYSINGGYSDTILPPKSASDCLPGGAHVLIANLNSARDDNFDIYLNGVLLGPADLSQNSVNQAVLFIWSNAQRTIDGVKALYESQFNNLVWTTTVVGGPAPGRGSPATILMQNTQDNDNNNLGNIYVGFLDEQARGEYNARSGVDISVNLTFPGQPPTED